MEKAVSFVTSVVPSIIATVYSYSNYITSFFDREPDPDATRSVPEIIESRGFRAEEYSVQTPDGYILSLFRIVNPFFKRQNVQMYPVILAHAALKHSAHWILNSDDGHLAPKIDRPAGTSNGNTNSKKNDKRPKPRVTNNLGFLLANEGYDVWLLNWRGSKYSRKHKKFTVKDKKFWNFSIDELIQYDLPTFVDFVLEKTGSSTVGYVGHAMGADVMFGLMASNPEYNSKIKPFVALAPTVQSSRYNEVMIPFIRRNIPIPKFLLNPILRSLDVLLQSLGPGQVPYIDSLGKSLAFIGSGNMFQWHLSRGMQKIFSIFYTHQPIDSNRLSVYDAQTFYWMSRKQASHNVQQLLFNEFSRYDYGEEKNKMMYGDPDPPLYDLKDITNRTIALIHSQSDSWINDSDIDEITSRLKVPVLVEYRIPDPTFSHHDYTFGSKVGPLVNQEIVRILKKADSIPEGDNNVTPM